MLRATSSNSIVACGGRRGIGSTRKFRLEIAGDSDLMEMTGDWSFSAASLKGKWHPTRLLKTETHVSRGYDVRHP
jgi:hypothetical protein